MIKAIDYDRMADLYDALVTFDADIDFFRDMADRVDGAVLELMAGTGRVSVELADRAVFLACVDTSARMLARLRAKLDRRGLSAWLARADVRRLGFAPVFDLALLAFNSFSELILPEDRFAGLVSAHAALRRGGTFICTLHNPVVRLRSVDGVLRTLQEVPHPSGRGTLALKARLSLQERGVVTGLQLLQEVDSDGVVLDERSIEIGFALPERDEFEALAQRAGFEIVDLWGDYDRSEFGPEDSP